MGKATAELLGKKGARLVSLSPGIIHTSMTRQVESQHEIMKPLAENTPLLRKGYSSAGTDLLMDGGSEGLKLCR